MTGSGSESGSAPGLDAGVIAALTELGFSQYEARTYAGLIGREPMTGYAIAKDTLVPQPKVYETLGRLVERGAVLQVSGSPAKFVAVAPARVLSQLERAFRQRLATVELEVSRMRRESDQEHELRLYKETNSWIAIVNAANDLPSGSTCPVMAPIWMRWARGSARPIAAACGSTSSASASRPSACTTG
jgi:sugar-specific transcriptional regulator TrmB